MNRYLALACGFVVAFACSLWLFVNLARGQATGPAFATGKNPRFRTIVTVAPEKVPNSTCGGWLATTASAELFSVPQGTVAELRLMATNSGAFACLTADGVPLRCGGHVGVLDSYLAPVSGPAKIALVFPALTDQVNGCTKGLVDPVTVELSGTLYKK